MSRRWDIEPVAARCRPPDTASDTPPASVTPGTPETAGVTAEQAFRVAGKMCVAVHAVIIHLPGDPLSVPRRARASG